MIRGYGDSYLNAGNVGIGTTGPIGKLNVVGDINASGSSSELFVYGTGDSFITGNLGIGTTDPKNTLNVVGTGNFTSNLTVSNQLNMFYNGTEIIMEY